MEREMEREKGLSGQIEEFARNYRQEIMDSAQGLPEEMPEITWPGIPILFTEEEGTESRGNGHEFLQQCS